MIPEELFIRYYRMKSGKAPFIDWIRHLDALTADRVRARLARIRSGGLGDVQSLKGGIYELRLPFGSGYRVYFAKEERSIVILLCGGDKGSQTRDIAKAGEYYRDYLERKDD